MKQSPTRTVRLWAAAIAIGLAMMAADVLAQAKGGAEYALKAALIFKLTKFITWPPQAVNSASGTFDLCVLGNYPFGDTLDPLTTRKVGDRLIAVHRHQNANDLADCHMIFVATPFTSNPATLMPMLDNKPVLTVSDGEGFANTGGMIEITRERNKLGFRINTSKARESGLVVAAPLLELATVVE